MKKIILVLTLSLNAFGQANRVKPPDTTIFYGGDITVGDPNAQNFVNSNTLLVPISRTYAAVTIPKNYAANRVRYFFMNVTALTPYFYPQDALYDIRTGVSEGNGGTSLASGHAFTSIFVTGREPFGLTEYQVLLMTQSLYNATPGTTYWINVTPQCTTTQEYYNCESQESFLDNTTLETNGINPGAQPPAQMYFNSGYFGYTWANWCDPQFGYNSEQCARASFGVGVDQ